MLASIRKALSSWVVVGLLSLLVAAFVLTSVQDPFSLGGGARLAKVGDQTVSTNDFVQQFDRIFRQEQRQRPELTREDVLRAGADQQVLNLLVTSAAFQDFAESQGVAAGARNLSNSIRNTPAFQIAGQFDTTVYEEVLAQNNMSRKDFQQLMASDLTRDQFVQVASLSPFVPERLTASYVRLLQETRTASVAAIPAGKFASSVGAPDAKALEEFYKANIETYTVPEMRSFRYILLSPEIVQANIQVTEANLKEYYDAHLDRYAGIEKREVQQLLLADEATARDAYDRVSKGQDFVAVAAELGGFEEGDLSLGEVTRKQLAEDTSEAAASAAFGVPAGTVTSPVQSELGWHLFRTTKISRSEDRPFATVKGEIEQEVRRERALDRIYELSREMEDTLASGEDLEAVGKQFNLPVVTVAATTRSGLNREGRPVDMTPQAREMLGHVFEQRQDEDLAMTELGKDTYYVSQVTDITPAAPRPLAEIKDAVTGNWRFDQMLKKARAAADAVAAAVKGGASFADAARKQGAELAPPVTVRRVDAMQQGAQLPAPVRAMFTTAQGQVQVVPAEGGQGYYILKVENVESKPGPDAEMLKTATKQEIQTSAQEELASAFAQSVRHSVGVKINEAALAQARARLVSGSAE
ncbi:MAG TPA: peptidyl-prolyl cis-trans isomerase [Pedomonas sp.]|uniref:peptidyl-prolyl cis-trans isomerase n=1 Tax=Pedomonas sp. TaxID=2976421 RepID=UPI002F4049A0